MNLKDGNQLDLLDMLSVLSFCIAIMNLDENITQGDKQDLMEELSAKADLLLTEIHGHLEAQDNKIDEILRRLNNEKDT